MSYGRGAECEGCIKSPHNRKPIRSSFVPQETNPTLRPLPNPATSNALSLSPRQPLARRSPGGPPPCHSEERPVRLWRTRNDTDPKCQLSRAKDDGQRANLHQACQGRGSPAATPLETGSKKIPRTPGPSPIGKGVAGGQGLQGLNCTRKGGQGRCRLTPAMCS